MNQNQNWQQFALLLIDVQNDFFSPEFAQAFPDFTANISQLLTFCRNAGLEVIHLREIFNPNGSDWLAKYRLRGRSPCVRGTTGAEVLNVAQEVPGEIVFEKQTMDGFLNPQLLNYLRSNHKRFLLTAGLATSVCVLFTSASAAQLGFLVTIVADCCADYPEAHQMVLKRYRGFLLEFINYREIGEYYQKMIAQIERSQSF
ncbi:cysteine hydrolase family protein [Floridanema evergladense]|uniref:Cysteine hydrolase family protein n=1 Tax=Floridaenema evergladense BLCC-F167 TaxID=3153639 RepID=A0ABV4WJ08_9CYAN